MAEKRQPFRFRLPRLLRSSAPARAPEKPTQTQRSAAGTPPVSAEPLRADGTAQVPSPPRTVSSPPRVAPEASPPSPPTPLPEGPPLVVSQPPDRIPEPALSAQEAAQPNAAEPQLTTGEPPQPVASASIPELSIPPETPLLDHPVPQPLLDPQQAETLLPSVPDLANAESPSMPTSPEQEATTPPSVEDSSLPVPQPLLDPQQAETLLPSVEDSSLPAVACPSFESQPGETTLPENLVPNTAAANPQQRLSPAMKVSTTTPLESSKPQKYCCVEVVDKEKPLPSDSSSHEAKRGEEIKFVPKKSMVLANTICLSGVRSSCSFQQEIKEDMSKLVDSITSGKANTVPRVDESVGVITLAGENTGATMQLTLESSKKKEHIHIRRNYRSDPDESVKDTTDTEEDDREIGQGEGDKSENCIFLNSNVQGVNNSVVLDSSVSEGCPGVHFELALNVEPQLELGDKIGSSEAFRDQCNATVTKKHMCKPTIRRRCDIDLVMASSDSDDDGGNPSKPRRHGCCFGFGLKNKEKSTPLHLK